MIECPKCSSAKYEPHEPCPDCGFDFWKDNALKLKGGTNANGQ